MRSSGHARLAFLILNSNYQYNMNHNTLTPLLHLIRAGYKTNTNQRHLRGPRLAMFYFVKWAIVTAVWALLFCLIYLISCNG